MSPIQLLQTRRLLLAKQLLTETALPITEVAFASGFSSLRRFNDAFDRRYGMPPTRLRRKASGDGGPMVDGQTLTLQLAYRPPYDWTGILAFLAARALTGIEHVTATSYARTVRLGDAKGWIRVTRSPHGTYVDRRAHAGPDACPARPAHPCAGAVRSRRPPGPDRKASSQGPASQGSRCRESWPARARCLQWVRARLARHPGAAGHGQSRHDDRVPVRRNLRRAVGDTRCRTQSPDSAPGAGWRSQRRRHRAPRYRRRPVEEHHRAGARAANQASCAWTEVRTTIRTRRSRGWPRLPGIGPWTAHYIAMRALRWPDAFPKEDIAVRNRLGGVTAKEAEALSQAWRPWRSYAVMHIWGMAGRAAPARRTEIRSAARAHGANGAGRAVAG